MNFWKRLPITKKIGLSFFISVLLLFTTVATTAVFISYVNKELNFLTRERFPTSKNTVSMINHVNHSLASLRGWMLLGADKMKDERAKAWSNIESSLAKMDEYSKNWTNPENLERLEQLKNEFSKFKKYQDEIENISNTSDNLPANKILLLEAAPLGKKMFASITELIDLEMTLSATKERKELLGIMADVRGSTAISLANIRAYLLSGNEEFIGAFKKSWSKNETRFNLLDEKSAFFGPKQTEAFAKYKSARESFSSLPEKMFSIRKSPEWNIANFKLGKNAAPTAAKILSILNDMDINQEELLISDVATTDKHMSDLLILQLILLVVGVITSSFLGYSTFKSSKQTLNFLSKNVLGSLSSIMNSTRELNKCGQELAASSEEQAASVEETSSTMNEIDAMVKRNTDDAKASNDVSIKSHKATQEGVSKMKEISGSLDSIHDSNGKISNHISESNHKMAEIVTIIKEIGEKTQVINDIVFQTKLLSFNASVEAARAGEHGKGFAVVAEEVGNLAAMSGKAAVEICEMLDESIATVEKVTEEQKIQMDKLMDESQDKINTGLETGKEFEAFLTDLAGSIGNLQENVNKISMASEEQSRGVEEITTSITEVNKTTRINAGIANETSRISKELTSMVEELENVVKATVSEDDKSNKNNRTQIVKAARKSELRPAKKVTKETHPVSKKRPPAKEHKDMPVASANVSKKNHDSSTPKELQFDDSKFEDVA